MITSDLGYRDSFESAGTFGPAPSQPRILLSPSQVNQNSARQMATSPPSINDSATVKHLEESLKAKIEQSSILLTDKLTTHGTKLITLKNAVESHNGAISSEINSVRDEIQAVERRMEGLEKRLIDLVTKSVQNLTDRIEELNVARTKQLHYHIGIAGITALHY
ncbi:hypothetical protein BDR04DRAFT_1123551 [Suillus decipiens]|nr:hypothetical protein BDR04DRAFT_1123551 [Suillus decipiens]